MVREASGVGRRRALQSDGASHAHKVLAAGGGLKGIHCLLGVLKALNEVGSVLPGQERVLASALNVPAPAGVLRV